MVATATDPGSDPISFRPRNALGTKKARGQCPPTPCRVATNQKPSALAEVTGPDTAALAASAFRAISRNSAWAVA